MPQAASTPKPLHIFKPGEWTTIAGEKIEFSEADLQATAKAYDPKLSKAPLVVGHPKTDKPAKGWTVALTANERGLFAAADKVDPEFAEAVRTGSWGTISAKFYRPTDANNPVPGVWYLRHVGFLGAQPPAVKGLDDPEFSESDDGCVCFQEGVEFSEWDAATSANLWRNLREWLVGQFGMDTADKVVPGYDVRALEIGAQEEINEQRAATGNSPAFSEHPAQKPPKESNVTEQEAAQLREQNAALQRQNEEMRRTEQERLAEAIRQDNVAFAESLAKEARIPSAMQAQVAAIGAQLQTTPDVEFGEGDQKKPLHLAFRELMQALPASVEFGEHATRERAGANTQADADDDAAFAEGGTPERKDQDKRIRAYAQQHGVSYASAAHAVMRAK